MNVVANGRLKCVHRALRFPSALDSHARPDGGRPPVSTRKRLLQRAVQRCELLDRLTSHEEQRFLRSVSPKAKTVGGRSAARRLDTVRLDRSKVVGKECRSRWSPYH